MVRNPILAKQEICQATCYLGLPDAPRPRFRHSIGRCVLPTRGRVFLTQMGLTRQGTASSARQSPYLTYCTTGLLASGRCRNSPVRYRLPQKPERSLTAAPLDAIRLTVVDGFVIGFSTTSFFSFLFLATSRLLLTPLFSMILIFSFNDTDTFIIITFLFSVFFFPFLSHLHNVKFPFFISFFLHSLGMEEESPYLRVFSRN